MRREVPLIGEAEVIVVVVVFVALLDSTLLYDVAALGDNFLIDGLGGREKELVPMMYEVTILIAAATTMAFLLLDFSIIISLFVVF